MTRRFFIVLILLSSVSACAQKEPNYSFFKLMVTNAENQVLLVNWKGNWEIPGAKYKGSRSIVDFTNLMVWQMGIEVNDIKLAGLFTFHYNNKPNPTLMHYYTTNYISGAIKPQPSTSEAKWFSMDEALAIIPYSDMVEIIKQINKSHGKTLGAAFDITRRSEENPRSFKLQSPFYQLN